MLGKYFLFDEHKISVNYMWKEGPQVMLML